MKNSGGLGLNSFMDNNLLPILMYKFVVENAKADHIKLRRRMILSIYLGLKPVILITSISLFPSCPITLWDNPCQLFIADNYVNGPNI